MNMKRVDEKGPPEVLFPAKGFTHIKCDGPNCGLAFPYTEIYRCLRCRQTHYCGTKCQQEDFDSGHHSVCQQQPGDKRKGYELNYADTGQGSQGNPGNVFVYAEAPMPDDVLSNLSNSTPAAVLCALENYWPNRHSYQYGKAPYPYVSSVMESILPEQPMESPFASSMSETDAVGTVCHWNNWTWKDAKGNVIINQCNIPPRMKALIQYGLRAKKLCWEYLYESNFMALIGEAHTPTESVENALKVMITAENKPNPGKTLEVFRHVWWKPRMTPGSPLFDRKLYLQMKERGMHLGRFGATAWNDDGIRKLCHLPTPDHPFPCECYSCSLRNLPISVKEARAKADWNAGIDHINKHHGELMCMSFQMYKELQANVHKDDDELWKYVEDCLQFRLDVIAHDKRTKELQRSKSRGGRAAEIANTLLAELGPPPEVPVMERDKFVNYNVSERDQERAIKILDVCIEEKRLPTHLEMDSVMRIIRESNGNHLDPPSSKSSSSSVVSSAGVGNASGGRKASTNRSSKNVSGKASGKDNSSSSHSTKPPSKGSGTLDSSSHDHSTSRPSRNSSQKKVNYYESESNTDSAGGDSEAYRNSDSESDSESDSDRATSSSESNADDEVEDFGGGKNSQQKKRAPKAQKSLSKPTITVKGYQKRHTWTQEEKEALKQEFEARTNENGKIPHRGWHTIKEAMVSRFPHFERMSVLKMKTTLIRFQSGNRAATREWTIPDETTLEKLVAEADEALNGTRRPKGFWTSIGEELGRNAKECLVKYDYIQRKKEKLTLNTSPLTNEDKQFIHDRVDELRCKGMFKTIGSEMGRHYQQIYTFFQWNPKFFADLDLTDGNVAEDAAGDAAEDDSNMKEEEED